MALCRPVDGRPEKHVTLEDMHLDVVESFRCLGDEICPEGGCELATVVRIRAAWGSFVNCFHNLFSKAWKIIQ